MRRLVSGAALVSLSLASCGNAEPGSEFLRALERLAASSNAEAIYHLGMASQVGAGVPKDPAKAFGAFRRAAALGDVLASYKLGCFYDGQGEGLVERDPELALRYKLVAAEAGYALAQQDVAALYAANGEMPAAVAWLEKAARQGWADALAAYASVHNGASGISPDAAKTAAYFRLFLDRVDASEKQRQWLSGFERQMSPEQRKAADEIVRSYRAAPTALTVRALSGQRAALELVDRRR